MENIKATAVIKRPSGSASAVIARPGLSASATTAGGKVTGTLSFQTYYTGSSAPSASLGVDGDIYLQTS